MFKKQEAPAEPKRSDYLPGQRSNMAVHPVTKKFTKGSYRARDLTPKVK